MMKTRVLVLSMITSLALTVGGLATLPAHAATPVTPMVAAGDYHTLALKADGTVWAWGHNTNGQLGDGTQIARNRPAPVQGLTGKTIVAITAGLDHSVALTDSGEVWAWGRNSEGQLGDGTATRRLFPVQTQGLAGVTITAVTSAGGNHTLALTDAGQVWAWGRNGNGQLGDNSTTDRNAPVQVQGLGGKTITAIAAGYLHSLVLTDSGEVWAWGTNGSGRLGDGTSTQRNLPVQTIGLASQNIKGIAAGDNHSLAYTATGEVWAWGSNSNGQLGDGTGIARFVPVLVQGLAGAMVSEVVGGGNHTLALVDDGTVWAWGTNGDGRLGDGTTTNRSLPTLVRGLSGKQVTSMAGGQAHSVAMTATGEVWAWGLNTTGQLGDGTTNERWLPAQVLDQTGPGFFSVYSPATSVSLYCTTSTLAAGSSRTLGVTVNPATAYQGGTWVSSNLAVATVNNSGVVTGVADGTATITVTSLTGGLTDSCSVTVVTPVTGVTVTPPTLSLYVGGSGPLTATVSPSNAANPAVTWTSSVPAVATVSSSGVVSAVGSGTTVVRATTTDGGFSSTSTVTVTPAPIPVTGVSVAPKTLSLVAGTSDSLTANVQPANADTKTVSWSSNNPAVATVTSSGIVTAVGAGSATITAVTTDGSFTDSCLVTVTPAPIPVTGVSVAPKTLSLVAGTSDSLTASVQPSNADNQAVTWVSSNPTVASVSGSGVVTALAAGAATITVTNVDGGFADTCAVTVTPAHISVTGISLTPSGLEMTVGASRALAATVSPAKASNKAVSWSSSDTKVATVNNKGVVTGKAAGKATITVKTVDGGKTAVSTVTVTKPPVKDPPVAEPLVRGMAQIVLSPSLAGAPFGDVLAVDQQGTLWRYPSSASGALGSKVSLGSGWGGLTVYAPGDWNNDGKNDVIAVEVSSGKMFLFPGNGRGGIGAKVQIGQGWGGFEVIPAGDLTGDGFADLLVIKESTGDLFLYAGNGKGGFRYPYPKVGYGWTGFQLFAAGDLNKDGKSDILSIDAKGNLFMYAGFGDGTFAKKIQVGNGWLGYQLAAGADLNGDGVADIVGRDSKGTLFFYPAKGGGFFHKKVQIATGW